MPATRSRTSTRNRGSKRTTDHSVIRRWAEARGGRPATVRGTRRNNQPGVLRIDFPGYRGKGTLQPISWDAFFDKFDDEGLEFLYQDKTAGGRPSRFSKIVNRPGRRGGG